MRTYLSNNIKCKFSFKQSPETFKVVENSNFKLQKRGGYKLLEVKKSGISTIELIEYLAQVFKIKEKDISYAGLKDKHAKTIQYLTVPKWVNLSRFKNSPKVSIKEVGLVANRIKIGELKSNSFEIVLNSVDKSECLKIEKAFKNIEKNGFANFFGYQRFGVLDDATAKGKKISDIGRGAKNQKSKILVGAYQAKLFNNWLEERLQISKNLEGKSSGILKELSPALLETLKKSETVFKLLPGDLGFFYKKGKKEFKYVKDITVFSKHFAEKKFFPTGALYGRSVKLSASIAGKIERKFNDYSITLLKGARRAAWVYPKECKIEFKNSKAILHFTLPPGSYATVLLEELQNKSLV